MSGRLRRDGQVNDEKGQEERYSEGHNLRLRGDDVEDKMAVKLCQHPQRLSDSENEEPIRGRVPHRSAFVSKSNANSLASLTWNIHSKAERSQSCNDTVTDGYPHGRRRAAQVTKVKVLCGGCTSAGVVGVLLSTENSRSFSAPVLTSEKRLTANPSTSFTPLQKPERSISPESNDSISEELNHFKPIVCSPCTPPKRLPDGQVLSPVIIKSTPRNLRKSLQKPTSYEASPLILKKWEQVFQDRQMKRTLSKGTLTSSVEAEEDISSQNNQMSSNKDLLGSKNLVNRTDDVAIVDLELLPSSSKGGILENNSDLKSQALPSTECLLGAGQRLETKDIVDVNKNSHGGTKVRVTARLSSNVKAAPPYKCLGATSNKPTLKRPRIKSSQPMNLQNGFTSAENISPECPQRRGQKRRCKTKHLEQNGSLKRLKVTCGGSCTQGFELLWRETEKRLQQEEEDKKIALKLQQMFDKETRTVNRCKGSRDEYPLRSKSTAGAN